MTEEKTKKNENSIFIGGKPLMNYVTGVVFQFTNHNAEEVTIKSRGKFISKAVDVAEVARRKFLTAHKAFVKEIRIGSEEFKNKDDKMINVSTLEIVLKRG